MIEREYSENIIKAYRAVAEWIVRGLGQPPQWPRSAMEWLYYQSRVLVKEYYHTIKKLEKTKRLDEIAQLLRYPATITHWLYFPESNFGHRKEYWAHGLSREEGIDFIEKAIGIMRSLRKEETFCQDSKNIILGEDKVGEIIQSQEFIEAKDSPEILATLPVLNTTLWHYVMLIQAGQRIHSVELHGPYDLDKGELLFVREYSGLRPVEPWEFTVNFPYEKVTLYEIYRDLEINIDMFGHYWTSEHPYAKLVRIAVNVNDLRNLEHSEVRQLYQASSETLEEGNSVIRNFARQDWVRKWVELSYLAMKPLKEVLGEDYRPPSGVLDIANDDEEARKAKESGFHHIRLVGRAIGGLSKEKAIEEIVNMHLKTIYDQWEWR